MTWVCLSTYWTPRGVHQLLVLALGTFMPLPSRWMVMALNSRESWQAGTVSATSGYFADCEGTTPRREQPGRQTSAIRGDIEQPPRLELQHTAPSTSPGERIALRQSLISVVSERARRMGDVRRTWHRLTCYTCCCYWREDPGLDLKLT